MTATQAEKAAAFRNLHERPGTFIIPNPIDGGSARILAALGFEALATSSGAMAGALGRRDGHVSREEAMEHCGRIVRATDLPVSGDLEHGYGDEPAAVARTIELAAAAGLVGCSIEDSTGDREHPLFEFEAAVARVAAAVEAARKLPFPFMLTARTENFTRGDADFDETVRRLRAFESAGADVLFAPGIPTLDTVRAICQSVSTPVNFMAGIPGRSFTVRELAEAGVKRVSVATSLYRAAMTGVLAAARELLADGTFNYVDSSVPPQELNSYMEQ